MQTRDLLAARRRGPIRLPSRPVIGFRSGASAVAAGAEWLAGPGEIVGSTTTDLEIRNDSPRQAAGRLGFASALGEIPGPELALDAGDAAELSDAMRRVPGASGPGALVFEGSTDAGGIALATRTYVAESRLAAGPEVESTRVLAGLSESDATWSEIEAVNRSGREIRFELRALSGTGVLLGGRVLGLGIGETRSWALAELFPGVRGETLSAEIVARAGDAVPDARALVYRDDGGRLALPAQRPGERLYLPVAGRAEGAGGTWVASDLVLASAADAPVAVRVRFVEPDREASSAPTAAIALSGRESRRVTDVLSTLFGLTAVNGVVELSADGPIAATAVLATRSDDGSAGPARASGAIGPDAFSRRTLLADSRTGAPSRIRLLNPDAEPRPVVLRFLAEDGASLGEIAVVIPSAGVLDVDLSPPADEPAAALRVESDGTVYAAAGADRIASEPGAPRGPVRVAR